MELPGSLALLTGDRDHDEREISGQPEARRVVRQQDSRAAVFHEEPRVR